MTVALYAIFDGQRILISNLVSASFEQGVERAVQRARRLDRDSRFYGAPIYVEVDGYVICRLPAGSDEPPEYFV